MITGQKETPIKVLKEFHKTQKSIITPKYVPMGEILPFRSKRASIVNSMLSTANYNQSTIS
tara:strand:+ start:1630 stop:1812 length:183 start_codon:yes stop_codon:yes gene_type:complete